MQVTLDLFSDLAEDVQQNAPEPAPGPAPLDLVVAADPPALASLPAESPIVLARRLYDECQSSKPDWDQLSDVTRGVWLERAQRTLAGDPKPWLLRPAATA